MTPTYSGCPAMAVIDLDIETHLAAKGVDSLRLERRLSPPWTTDWITDAAREKLRAYGIAPPVDGTGGAMCMRPARRGFRARPTSRRLPALRFDKYRKVSQFGSTPCKAAYRCTDCLEPFDYFKCI